MDKLFDNKQNNILLPHLYAGRHEEPKNYGYLNYTPNSSDLISNNLKKLNVNTITGNENNLGRILVNTKEKLDFLDKTVVYKLHC